MCYAQVLYTRLNIAMCYAQVLYTRLNIAMCYAQVLYTNITCNGDRDSTCIQAIARPFDYDPLTMYHQIMETLLVLVLLLHSFLILWNAKDISDIRKLKDG